MLSQADYESEAVANNAIEHASISNILIVQCVSMSALQQPLFAC